MQITNEKTSNLKPAPYNPRQWTKEQMDRLKESIVSFGFVEPLVVNMLKGREGTVVGGHMRLQAARELQIVEVPVVHVKLDEKRERELNVRLNKDTGSFDFDVLANEFNVSDLLQWGFTETDLRLQPASDIDLTLEKKYEVVITAKDENEQRTIFEKLTQEGYACRILTL